MNNPVLIWAFGRRGLRFSAKIVLLCLAYHYDESEDATIISIHELSKFAGLTKAVLKTAIDELESLNLIKQIPNTASPELISYMYIFNKSVGGKS